MGNDCCSSKKNNKAFEGENDLNDTDFTQGGDDQDNEPVIKGSDLSINRNGLIGATSQQNLFDGDEIFDAYVDENLPEVSDEFREVGGLLKFDYFLMVYKSSMIWNRVKFAAKKAELVNLRRTALKQNSMERYREIFQMINEADEQCLQDVLEEILIKIGITDKEFQDSLSLYFEDKDKLEQIKQAQQDAKTDYGEGLPKSQRGDLVKPEEERAATMSKKEAIGCQIALQNLSLDMIKELQTMPEAVLQNETQYLQPKLHDQLFNQTGVDFDDLDSNTIRLQLEKDPEYIKCLQEYGEKMDKLQGLAAAEQK